MTCSNCESEIQAIFERKPDGKRKCTYTCSCGLAKPKSDSQLQQVSNIPIDFIPIDINVDDLDDDGNYL